MKWIELVRVRSSTAALDTLLPVVDKQVDDISQTHDTEAMVLRHATYHGDLAVVMVRTGGQEHPRKTRAGLMLAELLAGAGVVDHAVWLSAKE